MKKYTEEELTGKFVIVFDTLVDGNQCMMEGEEGDDDYAPLLFDSIDEAIKEIFDDNHSMLESHKDDNMLEEYNEGVTVEMVEEMKTILDSGKVDEMRKFIEQYPQCNDSGSWVESATEFRFGRKAFYGQSGVHIEGKKLSEL